MGQLAGDSLGSLVEFLTPGDIRARYPNGVRDLADGGTWNTLAGQPTDDSEMALLLARLLAGSGKYVPEDALAVYKNWLRSGPFDTGATITAALEGRPNADSQSNGALMRVSPLGIFCSSRPLELAALWAEADAALTHPHPVCLQANALYVTAIARAIDSGADAEEIYGALLERAEKRPAEPELLRAVRLAGKEPPRDYVRHQGWVLIALQNALWQLLHAPGLEEGVVDTVMRGGDTDTNAAICGALLGAVHGIEAVPERWTRAVLACRPQEGKPGVRRPRPACYWPVDALDLARALAGVSPRS